MRADRVTFRPTDRDRQLIKALMDEHPWLDMTAVLRMALERVAGEKVKKKR